MAVLNHKVEFKSKDILFLVAILDGIDYFLLVILIASSMKYFFPVLVTLCLIIPLLLPCHFLCVRVWSICLLFLKGLKSFRPGRCQL